MRLTLQRNFPNIQSMAERLPMLHVRRITKSRPQLTDVRHQNFRVAKKAGGTAHWRSEYNFSLHDAVEKGEPFFRQRDPPYDRSLYPGNVVGRMDHESSHRLDYGTYGSNPRDRIRPGDSKLPVLGSMLIDGTIKGTGHVPGYQGHVPSQVTPRSARAGKGMATRSNDKTNITDIFHTNLVGYHGHRPEHFSNDAGGRRATSLTTHGSDFVNHLR